MPALGQTVDITGQKFGMLTAIRRLGASGYTSLWLCKCDCGKQKQVRLNHLRGKQTQSCGCMGSRNRPGDKSGKWSGSGPITGTVFAKVRASARRRGFEVSVTVKDLERRYNEQHGRCALTGLKLTPVDYVHPHGTASLDRIDSKRGYTMDNIQWVHKDVNKMKLHYPEDYFFKLCRLIAERHPLL